MQFHGTVLWTELNTKHVEKAKAFYAVAFGYSWQAMPMPGDSVYWIGSTPEATMGTVGLFEMKGPAFEGIPDHWLTYFGIDDIDARLAALPALGGQVIRPAWDVPNVGRIAIVRGASGAVEGWMTPISRGPAA